MTIIDDRTPHNNWPLPNSANQLADDADRLRLALTAIDAALETKASLMSVEAAIAALVASAPAALDTLNELAAALGNDVNFSTAITNALATKATRDLTNVTRAVIANKLYVTASANPTTSDDGYPIGTRWINTTTNEEFTLVDATTAAAKWRSLSALTPGTSTFSNGTLTLDWATGTVFSHTATAAITSMVLSNAPTAGESYFLLRLTNGGAYAVAFPTNYAASGGLTVGIGTLTASGVDEILFRRKGDGSVVKLSIAKDVKP